MGSMEATLAVSAKFLRMLNNYWSAPKMMKMSCRSMRDFRIMTSSILEGFRDQSGEAASMRACSTRAWSSSGSVASGTKDGSPYPPKVGVDLPFVRAYFLLIISATKLLYSGED